MDTKAHRFHEIVVTDASTTHDIVHMLITGIQPTEGGPFRVEASFSLMMGIAKLVEKAKKTVNPIRDSDIGWEANPLRLVREGKKYYLPLDADQCNIWSTTTMVAILWVHKVLYRIATGQDPAALLVGTLQDNTTDYRDVLKAATPSWTVMGKPISEAEARALECIPEPPQQDDIKARLLRTLELPEITLTLLLSRGIETLGQAAALTPCQVMDLHNPLGYKTAEQHFDAVWNGAVVLCQQMIQGRPIMTYKPQAPTPAQTAAPAARPIPPTAKPELAPKAAIEPKDEGPEMPKADKDGLLDLRMPLKHIIKYMPQKPPQDLQDWLKAKSETITLGAIAKLSPDEMRPYTDELEAILTFYKVDREVLALAIESFELTPFAQKRFKLAKVYTLGDLAVLTKESLGGKRFLGPETRPLVNKILVQHGLKKLKEGGL